jgi:hypothetical protein
MAWTNGDLATAATAVIALAALLRPEIESLFRRASAAIDVHPAGRIEVGFSNFGPTIGLQGTMRAIRDDEFIIVGKVTVERVTDNLRHEFDWAVFRPLSFSTIPNAQQTFEIAAGFPLSVSAPRRFNIQFHDSATAGRFQQPLAELQRLWTEYLRAQAIVLANVPPNQIRPTYDAFHQAHLREITPLFQLIDREFYWVEGQYRMMLELRASRPKRAFSFTYIFSLSASESASLRLNCVACMMAMCNVPDMVFNFASPAYMEAQTPLSGLRL